MDTPKKEKQKENTLNPGNSGMYKTVHVQAACEAICWSVPGPPQAQSGLFLLFCKVSGRSAGESFPHTSDHIGAGIPPAGVIDVKAKVGNSFSFTFISKFVRTAAV